MKYLFFDTESANCRSNGNIFSFGYLITDEDFNVCFPQTDIVINPRCKFDPYVKKHILAYKTAQIKSAPNFSEVYDKICEIMTAEGVICIGYGVENDLKFLNGDCARYGLEKIPARFYDVQTLIKQAENRQFRKLSVEYAELTGGTDEHAHRSDADAYFTMRVAQEICKKNEKSLEYYLKSAPAFIAAEREAKLKRLAEKQKEYEHKHAENKAQAMRQNKIRKSARSVKKTENRGQSGGQNA